MTRAAVLLVGLLLFVPSPSSARSTTGATRLAIALYPKGTADTLVRRYTLRCSPAAGSVPRPARACRVLASLSSPFAPVPRGTMCAQIAGGPQEATVTGLVRGRRVSAHLNLNGSCQIERWRRVSLVVPGFRAAA